MKKISILIHYTHKQTLGHTTRVVSIANELIYRYGSKISLNILQGGIPQPFIHFPKAARVINIPVPFDSRASFKGFIRQGLIAARTRFVLETARRLNPDVFITEFFPFGRIEYADELLPTLKHLRSGGTRIYASIGYPHVANIMHRGKKNSLALILQIINLYDQIMIHTPEGLENPYFLRTFASAELKKKYANFFESIAHKITYTGYILPRQPVPIRQTQQTNLMQKKADRFNIIVSRGGGAVYPKIIANAIQAQQVLGDNYRFVISSGPATTTAEKNLFLSLLKKYRTNNIALLDYLPDLSSLFKCAHATVNMCGYNTSVQLLNSGTPSIVIPYVNELSHVSSNEQLARSLLLHDHIQSTVLPYEKLNTHMLAQAIHEQCNKHRPQPVPQQWFRGNIVTAQNILRGISNHASEVNRIKK